MLKSERARCARYGLDPAVVTLLPSECLAEREKRKAKEAEKTRKAAEEKKPKKAAKKTTKEVKKGDEK